MIIGYTSLCKMVEDGVIENVDPANINGASIDLTLGNIIFVERRQDERTSIVDLSARPREFPEFTKFEMNEDDGYLMHPGMFILGASREVFNLPNNISFNYRLNSSLGRAGLNHALAGFADPGWHGSNLTLELKNWLEFHLLLIRPGMKVGQAIFYQTEPVPEERSYAKVGSYNKSDGVTLRG